MTVPRPRQPRCYTHHVWVASCPDCADQRHAEQEAARRRLAAR